MIATFSKPGKHAIAWCDKTWNWLVGCSRISPECDRCYAELAAKSPRLQQFPQYQGIEKWDGTVNFVESQLLKPIGWRNPRKIFTCSMSDIFHESVPDEWIDKGFAVMLLTRQHTYQVLSKRTDRIVQYFSTPNRLEAIADQALILLQNPSNPINKRAIGEIDVSLFPWSHIWLGATAGCQDSVKERLPFLSQLTRQGWATFVSAEPLLENINLDLDRYPVDQVIAGAESGKGARPMNEDWVRSLRDQCQANGTAFFYKQNFIKGKKVSLPELDGRTWTEFPIPAY